MQQSVKYILPLALKVTLRENTDQNNSEYGQCSRRVKQLI